MILIRSSVGTSVGLGAGLGAGSGTGSNAGLGTKSGAGKVREICIITKDLYPKSLDVIF